MYNSLLLYRPRVIIFYVALSYTPSIISCKINHIIICNILRCFRLKILNNYTMYIIHIVLYNMAYVIAKFRKYRQREYSLNSKFYDEKNK